MLLACRVLLADFVLSINAHEPEPPSLQFDINRLPLVTTLHVFSMAAVTPPVAPYLCMYRLRHYEQVREYLLLFCC